MNRFIKTLIFVVLDSFCLAFAWIFSLFISKSDLTVRLVNEGYRN